MLIFVNGGKELWSRGTGQAAAQLRLLSTEGGEPGWGAMRPLGQGESFSPN